MTDRSMHYVIVAVHLIEIIACVIAAFTLFTRLDWEEPIPALFMFLAGVLFLFVAVVEVRVERLHILAGPAPTEDARRG